MKYEIKRGSDIICSVNAKGTQSKKIMGENIVSIEFELNEFTDFLVGDTIDSGTVTVLGNP